MKASIPVSVICLLAAITVLSGCDRSFAPSTYKPAPRATFDDIEVAMASDKKEKAPAETAVTDWTTTDSQRRSGGFRRTSNVYRGDSNPYRGNANANATPYRGGNLNRTVQSNGWGQPQAYRGNQSTYRGQQRGWGQQRRQGWGRQNQATPPAQKDRNETPRWRSERRWESKPKQNYRGY